MASPKPGGRNEVAQGVSPGWTVLPTALLLVFAALAPPAAGETPAVSPRPGDAWVQWGGPTGDFQAPARGLAANWPEGGPERLWSRPLGDGYSAILVDGGRLYTMYRADGRESVICLDAETGRTVWEHRYQHATFEGLRGYGIGPRSTPLIAGDTIFTIGITGKMHALSRDDGTVLWHGELSSRAGGTQAEPGRGKSLGHGYSSSPVAWKDMVIAPVGGEGASLVAFDQKTGDVRWQALSFKNSHSSPRVVEIAGEQQLVAFMAQELIGVDPDTGALRWRYPHGNQWNHNITVPLVVAGDAAPEGRQTSSIVFLSSPQAGARGLRLSRDGESILLEELWSTRRIQFYHASTVLIGDWVYGSTGVTSPAFMAAVNVRTGEIGWRQRGFAKANTVQADGKLVILDEDGVLYLATATPEELIVHASTQLLSKTAWTVPTIVGKTLYARDRKQIVALNLG